MRVEIGYLLLLKFCLKNNFLENSEVAALGLAIQQKTETIVESGCSGSALSDCSCYFQERVEWLKTIRSCAF